MRDDRQWVSIAEAARRLGISVVTVRRKIKQGALEGELQQGRRGPEYRVRLPVDESLNSLEPIHDDRHEHDRDDRQDDAETTQQTILLMRLLEQQQADLRDTQADLVFHAEQAAEWRTRAELLDRQAAELRAELERARRPWWRRLLGG
jgi:excisionase family DNA binding protein